MKIAAPLVPVLLCGGCTATAAGTPSAHLIEVPHRGDPSSQQEADVDPPAACPSPTTVLREMARRRTGSDTWVDALSFGDLNGDGYEEYAAFCTDNVESLTLMISRTRASCWRDVYPSGYGIVEQVNQETQGWKDLVVGGWLDLALGANERKHVRVRVVHDGEQYAPSSVITCAVSDVQLAADDCERIFEDRIRGYPRGAE